MMLLIFGGFLGKGYFLPVEEAVPAVGYIKWVNFDIPASAMKKAMQIDIAAHKEGKKINWIELLAYVGTKYGGNWSKYKSKDIDKIAAELKSGKSMQALTAKMKNYNYFFEAYDAVLHNYVGEYTLIIPDEKDPSIKVEKKSYGLKAYSPIAAGRYFNHYQDFGNERSYGFKRKHLGNDLMGGIGTPIVAVESGYVEALGWNMYGGWRVGIRSFDKKRYYYYAHLRKGHPYHASLYEGKYVKAGDVIGYLGSTGYSKKEDVNGIRVPHLHFGLQLIFDESQKEGNNEIWIDVYDIVEFLQGNKSTLIYDAETKEFERKYQLKDF